MGCIFPIYAGFFVQYHSGTAKTLFILGCLLAGAIVGGLSYLIGKLTVLKTVQKGAGSLIADYQDQGL